MSQRRGPSAGSGQALGHPDSEPLQETRTHSRGNQVEAELDLLEVELWFGDCVGGFVGQVGGDVEGEAAEMVGGGGWGQEEMVGEAG